MTRLHHEVVVRAPADAVWRELTDLTAVVHYNPLAARVVVTTAHATGPGAARRCEGPQGAFCERVLEWEPGRSVTMELTESPWPVVSMRWVSGLASEGASTRLTQVTTYAPRFGPLGALLDRVVLRRQLHRGIGGVLEAFARHVEARERGGSTGEGR